MAYIPYAIPISIKGVVFDNGKVWLRKNQRNEWELPGGKLDKGEQPTETIVRELREELGFTVRVTDILQANVYVVPGSLDEQEGVLVVTYRCEIIEKPGDFELLGEAGAAEFKAFSVDQIKDLNMPSFYKKVIDSIDIK